MARNNFIFYHIVPSVESIFAKISSWSADTMTSHPIATKPTHTAHVHFDEAFKEGQAAIGVIIRYSTGNILGGISGCIAGNLAKT